MSETDIVQVLIARAANGDKESAKAADEIVRLRWIISCHDTKQAAGSSRPQRAEIMWKALNPKIRVRTHGLPFHEKVKARIAVEDVTDCWVWQGACGVNGYGVLRRGPGGKPAYCHRIMYEHAYGPVPEGHVVMHACDNRRCVNPNHLTSGTHRDNMVDMARKGRSTSTTLTDSDVMEIHRLKDNGETLMSIAHRFGISFSSAQDIVSGRRWGWIKA